MAWSQSRSARARRSTDGLGPAAIAGIEAPQRHAELVSVGDVSARFHRVGEGQSQLIQTRGRHGAAEHLAEQRMRQPCLAGARRARVGTT